MQYGQRQPMKSTSAKESTAFTMKSIKELIAEEDGFSEAVTLRGPLPKTHIQQPPHLRQAPVAKPTLKASAAATFDADITAPPTAIPASVRMAAAQVGSVVPKQPTPLPKAKPRSFFGRLMGAASAS